MWLRLSGIPPFCLCWTLPWWTWCEWRLLDWAKVHCKGAPKAFNWFDGFGSKSWTWGAELEQLESIFKPSKEVCVCVFYNCWTGHGLSPPLSHTQYHLNIFTDTAQLVIWPQIIFFAMDVIQKISLLTVRFPRVLSHLKSFYYSSCSCFSFFLLCLNLSK